MTNTDAKRIADLQWSRLLEVAATKGRQETRAELENCLKMERREGLPVSLAKARLVESALSGAGDRVRNIGDLYGLRQAHQTALIIGARMGDDIGNAHFDADELAGAADKLFRAWQAKDVL